MNIAAVVILIIWGNSACSQQSRNISATSRFLSFFSHNNQQLHERTISELENNWQAGYEQMLLEVIYLLPDRKLSERLMGVLQSQTGQKFGFDFNEWYFWLWNKEYQVPAEYAEFKASLYKTIDRKFETYFRARKDQALIRLDEVRWGGVIQDGIPPLRHPEMIAAKEASYLNNNDIVFGIEVNGDVRAYPKRILAWHEMFVDEIGGTPLVGVYCTLCGSVILYKTEFEGNKHQLGTSGFLYRSNKLMYDKASQSLWSTIEGKPVIGPLVNKGIELEPMSVVTSTWSQWKSLHPETKVLSLNTGHNRDYSEGAAYANYFSTDELMFNTPFRDGRLKNKDEILAIRIPESFKQPLAISVKFLKKNPVYHDQIGDTQFVILTDNSGANRVYESGGVEFSVYNRKGKLQSTDGQLWKITEAYLLAEDGRKLGRLPYHRAFWFGWHAAFPRTELIQ